MTNLPRIRRRFLRRFLRVLSVAVLTSVQLLLPFYPVMPAIAEDATPSAIVAEPSASPSPSPTPSPSDDPTATASATPSASPLASPDSVATPAARLSETPVATASAQPTDMTTLTPTPTPASSSTPSDDNQTSSPSPAPTSGEVMGTTTDREESAANETVIAPNFWTNALTIKLRYPFIGRYPITYGFGQHSANEYISLMQTLFGVDAHDGIDFGLPYGTDVFAAAPGTVTFAGDGIYGQTVIVEHPWGHSFYGHLSQLTVATGDNVDINTLLGLSGTSGVATGPHLHFGIRPTDFTFGNGYQGLIDPLPYFSEEDPMIDFTTERGGTRRTYRRTFQLEQATLQQNDTTLALTFLTPVANNIGIEIADPKGNTTDVTEAVLGKTAGPLSLTLNIPTTSLPLQQPGEYTMTVTTPDGVYDQQKFSWGVLALNPDRNVYHPGDVAEFALAVLDEKGEMVCDAALTLSVTSPSGQQTTLTTANGEINVNKEVCASKEFTLESDYTAYYQTSEPGVYTVSLTAVTANGEHTIDDTVTVATDSPFQIQRITATRIYPILDYPVILAVTPQQNYVGDIVESVPSSFVPSYETSASVQDKWHLTYAIDESSTHHEAITTGNMTQLRWSVNWQAGTTYYLAYSYNAPDVSPELYLAGPLSFSQGQGETYRENRAWQIASDATLTYIGSAEIADTASTTGNGWVEVVDAYGNDTRDSNMSVTYKLMGATPDSTVPVKAAINTGYGSATVVHVWRNVDQTTPMDATATSASGTNSAACDSPSITPVTSGAVVLSACLSTAGISAGDTTITAPTGYTNQADINGNGTTLSMQVGVASKAWTSGAENPAAWTNITTSTSDAWSAASIAIRPSGGTLTYVGTAENAGTAPYSVTISGLSLQQGDLVVVVTGWVYTNNGDPGVNFYDVSLSSLSPQEGDLVIVSTGWASASNGDPGVQTSGYTEIADLYADDTRDANLSINWKIMGSTPDTTISIIGPGYDTGNYGTATEVHVWRGADQSTPIDATTTTATAANSALWNSPSITPVTTGAHVLSIGLSTAAASAGDTTITAPTGYTNQADHNGNGLNMSMQTGIASKAWTSGAEDPAAWTNITTSTSDGYAAASVAIRPATTMITVSGTANGNNGATVKIAVNASVQSQTAYIVSGVWSFGNVTTPSANDIITVWVDGVADANESTAVTKYSSGDITGLTLNTNVLTLGSSEDTSLSLSNLDTYDCTSDEDIMHQAGSSHLKIEGDSCAGSTTNSYSTESLSILSGDTLTVATSETVTTYDIAIAGTVTSSGNSIYNIGHNWDNQGTFTASTSTVNLTGAGGTTQALTGTTSFYTLSATGSSARTITFPSSVTTTVTNSLTLTGASSQLLTLAPGTAATVWTISAPATTSVDYVSVSYSTNAGTAFCATHSTDGGNNTSWNITTGGSCALAGPTAYSFQRKTWYDGTRYWRSYLDTSNSRMRFDYSTDGSSWTEDTSARISTNTQDFSVFADSSNAYVAYTTTSVANTDNLLNGSNLAAYWKMNETSWNGTANEVVDSTANSIDGVRVNDATTTSSGKFSYAGTFDGTDDYVSVTDPGTSSALDITSTISLAAWVYPTSIPASGNWASIVTKGGTDDTNDQNYQMLIGNAAGTEVITFCFASGSNLYCGDASGMDLVANSWQHVAITYTFGTASSFKAYHNGVEYAGSWTSSPGTNTPTANNKDLWIGADDYDDANVTPQEEFSGRIDDLRIYNTILTSADMDSLATPGYDVEVRKASSYPGTSFAWSDPTVALNGASTTDLFQHPTITQDSTGKVWLTATYQNSTTYDTYAVRSTTANDSTAWDTATSLDSSSNSNRYAVIVPRTSSAAYATWIDGTAIEGKNYNGSSWDGSATSIDTGLSDITTSFSATGDGSGNVYLVYVDNETTDQVSSRSFNGTSWSAQALVSDTATATDAYPTISYDSTGGKAYAFWIDTSGSSEDIFYSSCTVSTGCDADSEWAVETTWKTTGSNTYITSNTGDAGKVFAEWYDGTNIVWDQLSLGGNSSPNSPTSAAQKTVADVTLATGDWVSATSIKFTATATDPDSSDTLYLCVEKDTVSTAFSNTEDSCGTGVAYSGSGVTVSVTISSQTDATEYHWQARVKDAAGAYSSWVSYGANSDTTPGAARDYGLDTTAPTGGTVYDGTSAGVDTNFSDSSLTALSANWASFDANVSGLNKYQYSIGTSAGGTDIKTWTDNGTTTSVTATSLTLQTSQLYYVNVRAVDNAGNTGGTVSSNGQIVAPSIAFTVSPATVTFNNLSAGNSYTDTNATTLTTSTNAYNGYVVRAFIVDYLRSPESTYTIGDFSGGTYASPATWSGSETGYGYTSSDTTIQGANKFGTGTLYAPFSHTGPGDIIADHTTTVSGSPITNEQFTITHKVKTTATQAATKYTTTVVYTATALY